jgi:hypothetical protein
MVMPALERCRSVGMLTAVVAVLSRRCLRSFEILFYAGPTFASALRKSMQRLTARFLLWFAIVGAFVPLALAAAAAPPHACCVRQAAHQCHGSFAATDQRAVRDTSCCRQDCCRAVRTSHSAHPQPTLAAVLARHLNARILDFRAEASAACLLASQSPRAPPQASIA